MDFFEAQDRSRRRTRLLLVLYALSTLAVAAGAALVVAGVMTLGAPSPELAGAFNWQDRLPTILTAGLAVLAFIALASLYRTWSLRDGGARVARDMGGTLVPVDTEDPLRRRLRNVVEEMSIASGVPVPDVFVLEHESGINAFAAGFRPEDAAVAVTRGTLERLSRDELQGVIAHEFSHILNGDMRLNIRLMGPLFGILALGMLGRTVLRSARYSRGRRGNAGGAVAIGGALMVLGYVGVLCARLIKAGVSRQREYLADASAVQFTRQPAGIAGALKKIGGLDTGSRLARHNAEEISHMLFATGMRSFVRLFATHPPLVDRIRRLDPSFSKKKLERLQAEALAMPPDPSVAGFAGPAADGLLPGEGRVMLTPEELVRDAGNPGDAHIQAARAIWHAIPERLREAVHSSYESLLLVLALVLHPEQTQRESQLSFIEKQIGAQRTANVAELYALVHALGPGYRLPLLDLAFPAVRDRPDMQLEFLTELVDQVVNLDEQLELFEYALARVLQAAIRNTRFPGPPDRRVRADYGSEALKNAVYRVFAALATFGHGATTAARSAFTAGVIAVDSSLVPSAGQWSELQSGAADQVAELDKALDLLRRLAPLDQRRVVAALLVTARHDGVISVAESELLRVVCAVLDCPLPPLYVHQAREMEAAA